MRKLSREYIQDKVDEARAAIAFASPAADLSFARATLAFGLAHLAKLDEQDITPKPQKEPPQ